MQRSEIRDAIRRQTLNSTGEISDADVNAIIDEAYNFVSQAYEWPWLEASANITVTANQTEYALPNDLQLLQNVVRSNKKIVLQQVPFETVLRIYGDDLPVASDASAYYVRGSNVGLVPTPSANETNAYVVYYLKTPTLMTLDTDQPEWAATWHHVLVDYGVYRIFYREEYFQEAEAAYQHFIAGLQDMIAFYNKQAQPSHVIVGDGVNRTFYWSDKMRLPGFIV